MNKMQGELVDISEYCESQIRRAGSQNCGLFGGNYDGGYRIQQNPKELAGFMGYMHANHKKLFTKPHINNYLEIGCCAAGTTRLLSDLFTIDRICLVDNGEEEEHKQHFQENFRNLECSSHFLYIGDSHSQKCEKWLENITKFIGKFELVFIDGDHTYTGIRQDTQLCMKFLDKDGFVLYHDAAGPYHPGVVTFANELKMNNNDYGLRFVEDFVDQNNPIGLSLFRKIND